MLSRRLPFLVLVLVLGLRGRCGAGVGGRASAGGGRDRARAARAGTHAGGTNRLPRRRARRICSRIRRAARRKRQARPRDRDDRAALATFYEGRQQEPVWTTATGLTAAAQAAIAEIRRAEEWGLDAKAFQLPAPLAAARSCRARNGADAEIALSLAVLKYARHAHGGRAEPTSLSRNLDRKLSLLDPRQVIEQAAKAASPDAYLRSLHPQHPQFEALRQKYLAAEARPAGRTGRGAPAEVDKKAGKKQCGRSRDTEPAQARRQHGAMALDAGTARRLLRLGQRPRVHAARRQGRQKSSTPSALSSASATRRRRYSRRTSSR